MTIEELLKEQAEWVERTRKLTLEMMRRRVGITPGDLELDSGDDREERIRDLVSRREAVLRAFDDAIATERRGSSDLIRREGDVTEPPVGPRTTRRRRK